jgi:hypothetical protein
MAGYPEHEKLQAVSEQTQAIGEFLEWLNSQSVQLMTWREDLTDTRVDDKCPCDGHFHLHCDHWGADNEAHGCCRCGKPFGFTEVTGIKGWVSERRGATQLLADWAGIDLNKIEAEKRQMLESIRAAQEG